MKKNQRMLLVLLIILYLGRCRGQKFSFGGCPAVVVQTINLNNPGLLTTWFEWARTPTLKEHSWKCVTYTFSTIVTNHLVFLNVRGHNKITRSTTTATGTVTIAGTVDTANNNALTGTLSVNFNNNNNIFIRSFPVVYTIIGRDAAAATSWITLYACRGYGFGRLEYAIILTSSRTPSIGELNAAFTAALGTGLPSYLIKKTDQMGC